MTEEVLNITLPPELTGRIDKVLAEQFSDLSRSRIKNLILDGCLQVDGVLVTNVSYTIRGGEGIELTVPPLEQGVPKPENIPLDIVFEDKDILVINKPAGLVVHPAPGNWQGTLVNALLFHCQDSLSGIGGVKRPGIVHRLDKETSGLLVVAKNDKAHAGLTIQFADRTLSRRYHALVWGMPKKMSDTTETMIGRSKSNRKKMAVLRESGKQAITHYEVKSVYKLTAALVECCLETGRTHQIRVHMAHIGNPFFGDSIYGRRPRSISQDLEQKVEKIIGPERHLLHAYHIHFNHPVTGEELTFEVDDPEDIKAVINLLSSL